MLRPTVPVRFLARVGLSWMAAGAACSAPPSRAASTDIGALQPGGADARAVDAAPCATGGPAALARYLAAPNPAFRWRTVSERVAAEGTVLEIELVSQRWHGKPWTHRLLVFLPAAPAFGDVALLSLRQGTSGPADAAALQAISRATREASAFLFDVPNQPIFDGREEDPLLAYTFAQFLRTGDESWPLLVPMVASAVRAMDVIQSLRRGGEAPRIARFVVAGHSKRGHTAWLTGAADPRVAGIIPIASDVLNSPAQIAHHRAVAGVISGSSGVFAETIAAAESPRGRCLLSMIDPYAQRDRLTAPKLIVLASNDDYTPADALNLYWDGLPGEKSVLYLPNASHQQASAHPDVNTSAFAFVRAVASRSPMTALHLTLDVAAGSARLRVTSRAGARAARLWVSTSRTRDFRAARWTAVAMRAVETGPEGTTYVGAVARPGSEHLAVFGEVEIEAGESTFKLSTPMRVVSGTKRDEPKTE
ncbi:MAG: PhoPQ-activated protein PqaA family protein [bacterium]